MPSVINASYRLPVSVGKTVRKAGDGLLSTLDHAERGFNLKWVGWPGKTFPDIRRKRELADKLHADYGYVPVFLTPAELDGFYYGFSNASIWPILHYMSQYMRYESKWWDAYHAVNHHFAQKVLATVEHDDDIVWVHDYQLMLLPGFLREERPNLRIGFFLHTPFPSYELFRCLPHREELIQGLLGSDQIGFHTFGYMRHFRSTVLRLVGYDSEMDHILHEGRRTHIGVYPIGIDAHRFSRELHSKRHANRKAGLRETYQGKKVVLSVERLDYSKGIERRLEAIDRFLAAYPHKDSIVFLFISIPSRVRVNEYRMLRERVESRIGQINGRHGTIQNVPVNGVFKSIPFSELCALYAIADAALVTPLIDGMNLVAKEYVACKESEVGVLLLSEFAGAAQELPNAVIINPFDTDGMAEKLAWALQLDDEEKRIRIDKMRNRVMQYDARYWARRFIKDLEKHPPHVPAAAEEKQQSEHIIDCFRAARRVACFLDYDGTLREFEQQPRDAAPMPEICELLCQLAENPRIDPYLISGRMRQEMQEWFAELDITLIAEHGFVAFDRARQTWRRLTNKIDLSWKDLVHDIFMHYEGTTPGSHIEEKHASLAWHYRTADPEFGEWKARQLLAALREMLAGMPVELHHGHAVVEVVSAYINKEAAVEKMLRRQTYDLVVCAGDDITDEGMLRPTNNKRFGIKIGPGETAAKYRIRSPRSLRALLETVLAAVESQDDDS